jgi:hypothetical protein
MDETNGKTWDAELPTLDAAALPSLFAPAVADVDKARQLSTDRRHVRRSGKAVMLDARRLVNALEHIGRLPDPREAFHLITEKRYSMMHVIPATLHLVEPATIRYLAVVTLSFSQANMVDLLALLDSGQIGKLDFLYSVYFRSNNKADCQRLADELTARGQRVYAGLIHAKLLLLELSDGRALVVESSANLRSCASIEQIMLTQDAALLAFHRQWIDDLLSSEPKP